MKHPIKRHVIHHTVLFMLAMIFVLIIIVPAMAFDACTFQPPRNMRQSPNVQYSIKHVSRADINRICDIPTSMTPYGCVRPNHKAYVNSHKVEYSEKYSFTIWVVSGQSNRQEKCIISHEIGHLPPNLWSASHTGKRSIYEKWN